MKRDFNKLIEAGTTILEGHPRQDMAVSEAAALLYREPQQEILSIIYDAFCAGVAAGTMIYKADSAKRSNK